MKQKTIRWLFLLAAVLLCAGGGLFLWRSGFFQAAASQESLRAYIQQFSPYSHLCFFLVQLLSVVLAPIPSNITALAGGVLFGTWPSFLMTFAATENDPVKNRIFSEALKNRSEIPLPPLGPNEEYEYIPAPRYTYNTDPAPLELPKQITNAKIVDAGSGRTAENLIVQYLYLSCTADGQHCMAVLTHSERNQKAFDGLFVFPYAEKQNYIPLVTFTAQSLRVRK